MSLSRPTASRFTRKLSCAAVACIGLLSLTAAPALAKKEPAALTAVQAVCPGQSFGQPFEASEDSNYYTLVQGSEFNGPEEGWELTGGAQVVETTRPDGSTGNALDLPSGAEAVSPPVCVTLAYPTARIWAQTVQGSAAVTVAVAYAGTRTEETPKRTGRVRGEGEGWTLAEPFDVRPQLGGRQEETRQVRFHFSTNGKRAEQYLFGLYVDPRMS